MSDLLDCILPDSLSYIGFMANLRGIKPPENELYHFHFDRFVPMNNYLATVGIKAFLYCPTDIDYSTNTVNGYELHDKRFIKKLTNVPKINCDYVTGFIGEFEKKNKSYNQFAQWYKNLDIKIYTDFKFSSFVADKDLVAKLIKDNLYHIKIPKYEILSDTDIQLPEFIKNYSNLFIKPKNGGRSERIIVLNKTTEGFKFYYYPQRYNSPDEAIIFSNLSLEEAISKVKDYATGSYIIQQGIEVPRYNNSPIEFRVLMVSDGTKWHSFDVTYLGFADSHVTNRPHVLDNSVETILILKELYNEAEANQMMDMIISHAKDITKLLDKIYPNQVLEMAYDFILDQDKNLYFLEVNTKPALITPMAALDSKIFNVLPEEQEAYDKYLTPYGTMLAKFLECRLIEERNKYLILNTTAPDHESLIFSKEQRSSF